MAPMTRNKALVPHANSLHPNSREASWQFVGSEMASDRESSEREVSEEPASIYDDTEMISSLNEEDSDERRAQLEDPEDHEDILHPLREAANRVGREVERFAEVLDGYNPLKATAQDERHEMTLDLIDQYHNIALDTVQTLRERHAADARKKEGLRWRKKMRGFKITHDEDELEDDEDEMEYGNSQTTLEDLARWEQEAQTWDLLRRLVYLRFPSPNSSKDASKSVARHQQLHQYSTEREVWDKFLETDDLALERKTVLDWLKDTAEESGEDIDVLVKDLQQNAERGDIIAHGWLHTKAAIKNQKRIHVWPQALDPSSQEVQRALVNSSNTDSLVTQLDPDAMVRQNRKLEAQDDYFERSIWLGCYEMLRRGRPPAEIREWCMERTEVWRAVSMSGLPDEESKEDDDGGNLTSSALWRRMCFELARKSGADRYERAVYGILSGDISTVEDVCGSWDDFIFVHYNALLRTQFDNYVQKLYPERSMASSLGVFDAVQYHGEPKTVGKRLIDTLKNDPRTAEQTLEPMKMLQGVLIANDFDHFIFQQGLALSKLANAQEQSNLIPATKEQPEDSNMDRYISLEDHDSLRVLAHILLIFIGLGLDLGGVYRQTVIENIIVSYIIFLRLSGKEELVPLYCSQLSGNRRYATLCRNLIDVTDPEQRITQIKLMRELGLDVQEFVKFQSRYLIADNPDHSDGYPASGRFSLLEDGTEQKENGLKLRKDFFGDDPDKVERTDLLLIRSLEWYLLVDGLWSETFLFGTMLYLRFFKHVHLAAARMLASRVPSQDIARSKTYAIIGQGSDFTGLESSDENEDLTEVLDGSAEDKMFLRKHLLTEAKSFRELEALTESLDYMETVTSMGYLLQEQSSPKWQKGWRQQLAKAVQPTRASIQPLLKGWLLSSQQDAAEFQLLREAYLPETIIAYVYTLQFAGTILSRDLLMECMDLSALIASEDSDLLDLFAKTGRMQELVEAFAHAGKSLLVLTAVKGGNGSRSKKLRVKGWTPDLWSVSPRTQGIE